MRPGRGQVLLRWGSMALPAAAALVLACAVALASPFDLDEFEFARASLFVSQGKVPFAQFWEHHPPLLWVLAAPVAGATLVKHPIAGLLALRGLSALMWMATGVVAILWIRRRGTAPALGVVAILLLFAQPAFLQNVVQFRVDTPMALLVMVGLMACDLGCSDRSRRWLWLSGLSLALAALCSQRAAPFALAAVAWAVADAWGKKLRPWALAKHIVAAAGLTACVTTGLLAALGALGPFWHDVVTLNLLYETAAGPIHGWGLWRSVLLEPLLAGSLASWMWWLALAASLSAAWIPATARELGLRALTLVWLACALFQVFVAGDYAYQFLTLWWLGAVIVTLAPGRWKPFAAVLDKPPGYLFLAGTATACLVLSALALPWNTWSEKRAEQAEIFRGIERFTSPGQVVWEGGGYAFGREPASGYWFTPTLVSTLEKVGALSAFDVGHLSARPPRLVIMDGRFSPAVDASGPEVRNFLFRNYLPVSEYLELWLPAAVGRVAPGSRSVELRPPVPGTYRLVAFPERPGTVPWFSAGLLQEIQEARPLPPTSPMEGISFETVAPRKDEGAGTTFELAEGQTVRVRWSGEGPMVVALAPVGAGRIYYPAWAKRSPGGGAVGRGHP